MSIRPVVATSLVGLLAVSGCKAADVAQADESTANATQLTTLTIAHVGEVVSDPLAVAATDSTSLMLVDALSDGLTALDATGGVAPAVAASWSTTDGAEWTFTLAERRFSDSTALTSADVLATFARIRSLAGVKLEAARFVEFIGDAVIEAPNDETVTIRLPAPNYELPALLAAPAYGIVSADAANASPTAGSLDLVGGGFGVSGPYASALVGRDGPNVTLRATGTFTRSEDSAGEVKFVSYSSVAMAWDAFVAGEADAINLGAAAVPGELPSGATESSAIGGAIVAELGTQVTFRDPAVRHGVAAALVPAGVEFGAVDFGAVVPSLGWNCAACVVAGDPAVLSTLASTEVSLHVGPGSVFAAAGDRVNALLTAGGVTVQRANHTAASLDEALDGHADITVVGVAGGATTPDVVLAGLFRSGGAENLSGVGSAELDAAIDAARTSPNTEARAAAYVQVGHLAAAQGSVLPLGTFGDRWVTSARIAGGWAQRSTPFSLAVISVTP